MEVGDQIRIARGALGLSQAALAEQLGISKQSVVWWETGSHRPKTRRIGQLEAVLKVKLDLSERGHATPLGEEPNSLAVDPKTLKLAVAIARLPLAQREAIETLVFSFEKIVLEGNSIINCPSHGTRIGNELHPKEQKS